MSNSKPIVKVNNLTKEFYGKRVVDDVSFEIMPGEVVALIGENGSGKSTLKNMMVGLLEPTAGEIAFCSGVEKAGKLCEVAAVHQELSVFNSLSVEENISINDMPGAKAKIDWKACRQVAIKYLEMVDANIDPSAPVSVLGPGERQLVEIAKALRQKPQLLVLDEPTASLTAPERKKLFDVMRNLKKNGIGMMFITHFIDEVYEICDKVVVLRNGVHVGGGLISEVPRNKLEELMVGRSMEGIRFDIGAPSCETVLTVSDFSSDRFNDINFKIMKGEILGIAGLMGAGRTELVESIYGIRKCKGSMTYNGERIERWSPGKMKKRGLLFISEDRRHSGIFPTRDLKENISIANLPYYIKRVIPGYGFKDERKNVEKEIKKHRIACPSSEDLIGSLSGGNQQKAIFARWLIVNPNLCIFDDPTRGVDIGAKEEISKIISELARSGKSIILVSSDINELLELSHRIIVMRKGCFVKEYKRDDFDSQTIIAIAATSA